MQRGLVGSEMCIRDRYMGQWVWIFVTLTAFLGVVLGGSKEEWKKRTIYQLLTDRFYRGNGDNSTCKDLKKYCGGTFKAVSYTHLTLPTILLVQISVVAVSLKKKTQNITDEILQLNNT
eukprot:TRINITY_DN28145_c0_g1_i1.p1 TRINITY_DN28145_c0_g1~~TRINITY_DN28145_c0_g1_i1.p1  ORF type:complete len:119 (-),score=35.50 TRINITY_DN28145_c0_g1_i1:35-391(-)